MTHRTIQPIAINGFEPGGTPRALPIFEWVDPASLLVDAGYQRDSSERSLKLVRKIVSNFDWSKFKAPVAVLTEAGLELIDGQHTAIAAATHPEIDKIPVMIVDVPDRAERAGAFIGHNKDRVAVTPLQMHVAAVAAGDPESLAVARVAAEAGVTVLTTQPGAGRYKPATTVGVNAIKSLIRGRGEKVAAHVLGVLARTGMSPINSLHMKAADLLLNTDEYSTQISAGQLVNVIEAMELKIDNEVSLFRAAHPGTPAWKAMAIIWFKNRRAKAMPAVGLAPVRTQGLSTAYDQKGPMPAPPSGDIQTASGKFIENIVHRPPVAKLKAPPAADGGKRDSRPKLNGWMPGPFLLRCSGCDEKYQGDQKSRSCADCAYQCREAVLA